MRNLKLLVLGLGLSFLALHADRGTAATTCEQQCRMNDQQCQITCHENPCLISCDQQLQYCLASCNN